MAPISLIKQVEERNSGGTRGNDGAVRLKLGLYILCIVSANFLMQG